MDTALRNGEGEKQEGVKGKTAKDELSQPLHSDFYSSDTAPLGTQKTALQGNFSFMPAMISRSVLHN